MIEVKKDSKSPTWIITHTDSEGFHKQLQIPKDDMKQLLREVMWEVFMDDFFAVYDVPLLTDFKSKILNVKGLE